MRDSFDRRIVSESVLRFVRACQAAVPCHLGGGAALSGAWLAHRLSRDIDLFVHDRRAHRDLVESMSEIAGSVGARIELVRDSGGHVRGRLETADGSLELDVVHEALPDLGAATLVESVLIESEIDLRASKLTCILSRSEPRDLADLYFLERAGFPPEEDLGNALSKDAGIDPGILAWLLRTFPTEPLPKMLQPLEPSELRAYRDALAERFRALSSPPE
jgi:hypothetical protein